MSDDLVQRLNTTTLYYDYGEESSLGEEAADRIEKLEAALQRANAKVEEYERKFYLGTDRIEQLEAALRWYANDEQYKQIWDEQFRTWVTDVLSDNGRRARKALEGKDD